ERVRATNAPPVRKAHFDQGDGIVLDGHFPEVSGDGEIYSVRRTKLDSLLVDAAEEAGAQVRQGFVVEDVLIDDGQAIGIRGRGRDATAIEERGRIVIGADGHRSMVARVLGAQIYQRKPVLSCAYYAYF